MKHPLTQIEGEKVKEKTFASKEKYFFDEPKEICERFFLKSITRLWSFEISNSLNIVKKAEVL